MTEAPLTTLSIPDRFEVDGPFVARRLEDRDVPVVAPAFNDPGIGGVTLRHFDLMRGVIEVGYWLFPQARGRGLATQGVRAVARAVFASGLWRLEARVRIGNSASERVLERAGFTREGTKRRYLRHDGERVDATVFSLLADE